MEKKEKKPMLLWAYPREYKDKNSASQTTTNPNEFTYPYYGSMVYWVTRGYVVLDDAAFPIVGEGDEAAGGTLDDFTQPFDSLGYLPTLGGLCVEPNIPLTLFTTFYKPV